jgi:spermidine/putrescine transport system permease protein
MYVWGAAQRGTPVEIFVVGTVMFLIALSVVIIGQVLSARRERKAA